MGNTIRELLKDNSKLLLVLILLLSLALRSATFITPHQGFDEVIYLKLAEKTYHNPFDYTLRGTDVLTNYRINAFGQNLPVPKYYNQPLYHIPPLFVYMIAISYYLLGIKISSAAIIPLLFGSISCLVVYIIGAELFNKKVGILAAFLNAVSSFQWVASTRIWNDIVLAFFVSLTFYFFYTGIENDDTKKMILAGLFGGIALLIKQSAILIFPAILLYVLMTRKTIKALFTKKIALFIIISAVIFLPWMIWVKSVYGVPWHMPQKSAEVFINYKWFSLVTNRPWYYLIISLPLTVPFYLFSYMGLATLKRDKSLIFLSCWFITFLAFFTIYPSGELRFLIPSLPALDIIASAYVIDKYDNLKGNSQNIILGFLLLTIFISLSVGVFQIKNNVDLLGVLFWI